MWGLSCVYGLRQEVNNKISMFQLSALYDVKPPISKAKMNSLTRGAIKAIKFYKHVVQSVEKFIQKVYHLYIIIYILLVPYT